MKEEAMREDMRDTLPTDALVPQLEEEAEAEARDATIADPHVVDPDRQEDTIPSAIDHQSILQRDNIVSCQDHHHLQQDTADLPNDHLQGNAPQSTVQDTTDHHLPTSVARTARKGRRYLHVADLDREINKTFPTILTDFVQ